MNTRPAHPDSLKVGDHVCIHSIRYDSAHTAPRLPFDDASGYRPTVLKSSVAPLGWPLQILAIDFPFVFCKIRHSTAHDLGAVVVDLRDFNLQLLTPDYVKAVLSFSPRLPPALQTSRHPDAPGQSQLPFRAPPLAPPDAGGCPTPVD